uniref:SUZ domain-containing protein n=1 Tax=Rhabditophanes sp. KR3021 TaxID=114890 RepID=A0AC35UEA4_9BILA
MDQINSSRRQADRRRRDTLEKTDNSLHYGVLAMPCKENFEEWENDTTYRIPDARAEAYPIGSSGQDDIYLLIMVRDNKPSKKVSDGGSKDSAAKKSAESIVKRHSYDSTKFSCKREELAFKKQKQDERDALNYEKRKMSGEGKMPGDKDFEYVAAARRELEKAAFKRGCLANGGFDTTKHVSFEGFPREGYSH